MVGTFFESLSVPLVDVVSFLLCWVNGIKYTEIRKILPRCVDWHQKTFVFWCKKARDSIHYKMIVQGQTIGGLGSIVEIDEAVFGKAKIAANRQMHPLKNLWLLGKIGLGSILISLTFVASLLLGMKEKSGEPGGGRTIIIPVKRRNAQTLEAAISLWVDPLTTIITDSWRGYNNLGNLGYTHHKIKHTRYFVHPASSMHTNNIEATWRALRLVSCYYYYYYYYYYYCYCYYCYCISESQQGWPKQLCYWCLCNTIHAC